MIETLSERLAVAIKKTNQAETASIAVMKYGLIVLFNLMLTIVLSLLIGALTGKFWETAMVLFAALIIRLVSGGYHFKSAIACTVVSTLIITAIPHIRLSEWGTVGLTLFGLVFFILFAPSNIKNHVRIPEKFFPVLKWVSVLIVAGNLILQSQLLALVFAIQGLSLIHLERGD